MVINDLLKPRNLLLAICLGAAAGACSIDTDDDDAGDDGDSCKTECDSVHLDCSGDCDDGDDACVGRCDLDRDDCEKDCD